MKTLIINGSPRKEGDTVSLLNILKESLKGEIIEISAYYDEISPCIDCRYCFETGVCCIDDKMSLIYNDDFNNVVIASPIYVSNLTGPLMSLASRLQVYYVSKKFLGKKKVLQSKFGGLMLVGGGDGAPDKAIEYAKWILKKLNANLDEDSMIFSLKTDDIPAVNDEIAVSNVQKLAKKMNDMIIPSFH